MILGAISQLVVACPWQSTRWEYSYLVMGEESNLLKLPSLGDRKMLTKEEMSDKRASLGRMVSVG